LANNAIVPIASKIALVYDLSSTYVNSPIVASLLVYSISNIPANYVMDKKGLRVSFLIGSALYTVGLLCYALINQGFFFVLIGSIVISLGQPFIINSPAKAATYWFTSKNVKNRLYILAYLCHLFNDSY
jgi:MFS transporter, FLVCR family, MFS-domain-containing protein 7